jgi:hypothetical protein
VLLDPAWVTAAEQASSAWELLAAPSTAELTAQLQLLQPLLQRNSCCTPQGLSTACCRLWQLPAGGQYKLPVLIHGGLIGVVDAHMGTQMVLADARDSCPSTWRFPHLCTLGVCATPSTAEVGAAEPWGVLVAADYRSGATFQTWMNWVNTYHNTAFLWLGSN